MTAVSGQDLRQRIRSVVGEPHPVAVGKKIDHLDRHCRQIISLSPFLALATTDADGNADCSPRGDPPGFVKVLDPRTLVIPDRPGNRLVDSFANLTEAPGVGLLFLVPGMSETLRVNGTGFVVDDPVLLETMAIDGRVPLLGLGVRVDEAFLQCGRAVKRARLWEPESQIERGSVASIGVIMKDHMTLSAGAGAAADPEDDIGAADIDEASRIAYERLYDEP
jgi:PPOX class probable FMN-dependent enzyme